MFSARPIAARAGHELSGEALRFQARRYIESDDSILLVAETEEGLVSGLIAGHLVPLIHQSGNVGRITAFVVGAELPSGGIGSKLLESLESWFEAHRCLRFEVTSNNRRTEAHRFYRAKGYLEDERRFIKRNDGGLRVRPPGSV